MENKTKDIPVQGAEVITEKAKRKTNTSYLLKRWAEVNKAILEAGLLTKEESDQLKKLHLTGTQRWIGLEIENI